jgi:hypothetical protein
MFMFTASLSPAENVAVFVMSKHSGGLVFVTLHVILPGVPVMLTYQE